VNATHGIGADQYNLELSTRRAAAVKSALVARYHVDAARLTYAGFGKSQPKDTNDTLEGACQKSTGRAGAAMTRVTWSLMPQERQFAGRLAWKRTRA
jgi:outer membrane protein OmpA-like peptidoglycan-associated protein